MTEPTDSNPAIHACCDHWRDRLITKYHNQALKHSDFYYMQSCLDSLEDCNQSVSDVPIAACIVHPDLGLLALCSNAPIDDRDPTAHAEIKALRLASQAIGNHRLVDCTCFTTVEPCAMCFYALMQARIARIVFAAGDPKLGILKQRQYKTNHCVSNHHFLWSQAIENQQYQAQYHLKTFFSHKRK